MVYKLKELMIKMVFSWCNSKVWTVKTNKTPTKPIYLIILFICPTLHSMVYELKEFMMKMVFNWYTSMVWIFKTTSGCFADLIDNHKAYYSTFLIMALTKDSMVYELKEFMMKMVFNWYTSMVWIVKTNIGCFADLDPHKGYYLTILFICPTLHSTPLSWRSSW